MAAETPFTASTTPAPGLGGLRALQVGVIINPRSHRNARLSREVDAYPGVHVAAPSRRSELRPLLADFAAKGVTCLVISGGDGTVRDVLTAGLPIFGDAWPEIAVIPSGKTNALNFDLGAPNDYHLSSVLDAIEHGERVVRRPLVVRDVESGTEVAGFILGAGIFTTAIAAGQDAHRLGAFNSMAVAATAVFGVLQMLLGSASNRWRRGVEMDIRVGAEGASLPRSRWGDPGRRSLLLVSSLERFPAGARPFGSLEGMKLAVLDHPRRRVIAAIPMLAAGWESDWLAANGTHRLPTDRIALTLGDPFILDGEAFPAGRYEIVAGPELAFIVP